MGTSERGVRDEEWGGGKREQTVGNGRDLQIGSIRSFLLQLAIPSSRLAHSEFLISNSEARVPYPVSRNP